MAKKIISLSIDEDVLIIADKMVYGKVEAQSRSHLIEMLILKEYAKFKKGK